MFIPFFGREIALDLMQEGLGMWEGDLGDREGGLEEWEGSLGDRE